MGEVHIKERARREVCTHRMPMGEAKRTQTSKAYKYHCVRLAGSDGCGKLDALDNRYVLEGRREVVRRESKQMEMQGSRVCPLTLKITM